MKLGAPSSAPAALLGLAASLALAIGGGGCGSGKSSHSTTMGGSSTTLTTRSTRAVRRPRRTHVNTVTHSVSSIPPPTGTGAGTTTPPSGGAGLTGGKPSVKAQVRGLPGSYKP